MKNSRFVLSAEIVKRLQGMAWIKKKNVRIHAMVINLAYYRHIYV